MWHTSWEPPIPGFPHELQFQLERTARIGGFRVLPRQDGNRNGWIKDYECYVSRDGQQWGSPVAEGTFPANEQPKEVRFEAPTEARFLRLVALSGHASGNWASLAEFEVLQ